MVLPLVSQQCRCGESGATSAGEPCKASLPAECTKSGEFACSVIASYGDW